MRPSPRVLCPHERSHLAVEITSPSNGSSVLQAKITDYLDADVRRVWVVDPPAETVTAWTSSGAARVFRREDVLVDDEVLPGFRLPLAAFFAL